MVSVIDNPLEVFAKVGKLGVTLTPFFMTILMREIN